MPFLANMARPSHASNSHTSTDSTPRYNDILILHLNQIHKSHRPASRFPLRSVEAPDPGHPDPARLPHQILALRQREPR